MRKEPLNIGYFRVNESDNDMETVKSDIRKLVGERGFGKIMFLEEKVADNKGWKEYKIGIIVNNLKPGDRIIVPDLTRLGRSSLEVFEILKTVIENKGHVYAIKGNLELNEASQFEMISSLLDTFSNMEKEFVSYRTKRGLEARKAAGVKLGRPKGPGKSKLDSKKDEIISLLKSGSTKAYIARKYKTTTPNLYNWLKKNKINIKPDF